ncbi:MAG: ribonuclease P protein component [Firmicutes bacterium]|nr:ribonuclease P protein component [Bacillota bacterium]
MGADACPFFNVGFPGKGGLMKKENRLRRRSDFAWVYRRGKSYANKYLVIYVTPNGQNLNRFGFSVGKRLGKAVKRNRIRRRLRELCRLHLGELKKGYDIVVIPRNPAPEADHDTLRRALRHLFHKANIFGNSY